MVRDFNIRTPARHVSSDGHVTRFTGLSDNVRFPLVLFGVQDIMFNAPRPHVAAQFLTDLYGSRTNQHGAAGFDQFLHVVHYGVEFLPFRFVDQVVTVVALNGAVGGDDDYIEFVDIPEFPGLRFGRTGHAR